MNDLLPARPPVIDERSQERYPEQWRAGLVRLDFARDAMCVMSGRDHTTAPAHLADTPFVCGHEATWAHTPVGSDATDVEYVCDSHAGAVVRHTDARRDQRRRAHTLAVLEITLATSIHGDDDDR